MWRDQEIDNEADDAPTMMARLWVLNGVLEGKVIDRDYIVGKSAGEEGRGLSPPRIGNQKSADQYSIF